MILVLMVTAPATFAGGLNGYWSGTVTAPSGSLGVAVTIDDHGATIDSSPLGLADQALTIVNRTTDHLTLEMRTDGQPVTAELTKQGDDLNGSAAVGAATYPVALHRGQKPEKTSAMQDVSIRNGDVNLAATLYLPRSDSPVPAVVFVAGLVPRDGAVHFLADAFVNRGIAVITYDHRGVGKSTGDRRASFSTLADDACAAIRYLGTRKEVEPTRIGLRGQSQGAWIAPLAATRAPVAFAILTGGGGVRPWESEMYAIPARMRADGFSDAEIAEATKYMEKLFAVGRSGENWEELSAMMADFRRRGVTWFGNYGPVPPSLAYLRELWEGDFSYDPLPALKQLTVPVLAMIGEKDVYSPPAESLHVLESALATKDKTLRTIKDATHDFRVTGGPLPLVSDEYLGTLLSWTTAHAGISAKDPSVTDHRVVSRQANVTIDVDPALRFVGQLGFDIRDAAHAERVIFASADADGSVRRIWIAQFEQMLPQHRGAYDEPTGARVRMGPFTFSRRAGRYSFAESIATKPGAEAEKTRDFLARKGLRVDSDFSLARFEALTGASRRAELIIFYWEDLSGNTDFDAFAEKAKEVFTLSALPDPAMAPKSRSPN